MTIATNYQHTPPAATLAEHGRRTILLVGALMLSACGGGGGGGGTVPTAPPPIEIDPTKTIRADGPGKQVSYTWDAGFSDIGPAVGAQAGAILEFDASGKLATLTIETTTETSTPVTTKISFIGREINPLNADSADFWIAENRASKAIVSNPMSAAWDYQTFGVWESGLDAPGGYYGAMSVGETSPVDAIPLAQGATFEGKVVGSYVTGGIGRAVLANLTVDFDAGGQTLRLSTYDTRYASGGLLPGLDMTDQTLTYVSGTSGFSGDLTTSNNGLSGASTGQFYGPSASELGGVFFLRSAPDSPVETYSGAYGAQQIPAP